MKQMKEWGSATVFSLVAALCGGVMACEPAGEGGGDSARPGAGEEVVAARPDAGDIQSAFGEALWQRWHDQESGRYERPGAGEAIGQMIRRFHGYR